MHSRCRVAIIVLLLSITTRDAEGNIVLESKDLCSVPEIGVHTTKNAAFFEEDPCNSTTKCNKACVKLNFMNGTCRNGSESLNIGSTTAGCTCFTDQPVMLMGRETVGNYQLNNWTLFWTGCAGTRSCQATCNEGQRAEKMVDSFCLPWPKKSRICACKPEKPLILTGHCGNTDASDEIPEEKKSYFVLQENVPGYYTKTRIAINAALLSVSEILGQIIIISL